MSANFDGTRPSVVHRRARETHADPATRWQETYSYYDGTAREIAKKVQAEPGRAMQLVGGQCVEVDANPRWVGTGRTVFDNKGNPIKPYEPYFTVTSDYEDEDAREHAPGILAAPGASCNRRRARWGFGDPPWCATPPAA